MIVKERRMFIARVCGVDVPNCVLYLCASRFIADCLIWQPSEHTTTCHATLRHGHTIGGHWWNVAFFNYHYCFHHCARSNSNLVNLLILMIMMVIILLFHAIQFGLNCRSVQKILNTRANTRSNILCWLHIYSSIHKILWKYLLPTFVNYDNWNCKMLEDSNRWSRARQGFSLEQFIIWCMHI